MEPWLDSLSEDWKSEHQSSSLSLPQGTPDSSLRSSLRNSYSQSRIPRISTLKRSQESVKANYLRPRSQKGLARSKESPVLGEHSSSQLNVAAHQADNQSKATSNTYSKDSDQKNHNATSTIPRKASATLSGSLQSVQHHTMQESAKGKNRGGALQWKKTISGPGGDLFGPTKLEGMFQQPRARGIPIDSNALGSSENTRPWSLPFSSSNPPSENAQPQQNLGISRNGVPEMAVLHEENEDEGSSLKGYQSHDAPTEQDHVSHVNEGHMHRKNNDIGDARPAPPQFLANGSRLNLLESCERDPRLRTLSGMEEIRNEDISPITMSRTNTFNMKPTTRVRNLSFSEAENSFGQQMTLDIQRPSSASSDSIIYHRGNDGLGRDDVKNELLADMTSNSLPDDLSMGTQDFVARGGFVNTRRGGYSNENSFLRRNLSSSSVPAQLTSGSVPLNAQLPSSPPSSTTVHDAVDTGASPQDDGPATPTADDALLSSTPSPTKSSGSPLKLFGNYDTFTSNKLLTRIGQFEDVECKESISETREAATSDTSTSQAQLLGNESQPLVRDIQNPSRSDQLRMSQFGQGDLDQYAFSQRLSRSSSTSIPQQESRKNREEKIFDFSPEGTPEGAFLNQNDRYISTSLPKVRKTISGQANTKIDVNVTRVEQFQQKVSQVETYEQKRSLRSPGKERTPKRRRTILADEAENLQVSETVRDTNDQLQMAGRKRKDARYDAAESVADPDVLATRQMLRPKITQRRSSSQRTIHLSNSENFLSGGQPKILGSHTIGAPEEDIVSAVTGELANAGADISHMANEARKGSVTTQDFLNEATKIMNLIRQKGKQKAAMEILKEPENESESELVTDEFADSTKENFSRPPSREGSGQDHRMIPQPSQDPRVVSHLRKYAEEDDPAVALNSSMASLKFSEPHNRPSSPEPEAFPETELQMSPANIRIRERIDEQRKRKHSASTTEDGLSSRRNTQSSYDSSTGQSIPTASSKSSGQKGVITPGKVEIPNQLGPMVFDSSTKTWIKKKPYSNGVDERKARAATSDEDPFEDIPDLSIDEARENARLRNDLQARLSGSGSAPSKGTKLSSATVVAKKPADSPRSSKTASAPDAKPAITHVSSQKLSEEAEHEIRVHEGRVSEAPGSFGSNNKQPRVVTITFSSPLVSGVVYQDSRSVSDATSHTTDRASSNDAAFLEESIERSAHPQEALSQRKLSYRNISAPLVPRRRSGVEFLGRPVSRIDEQDEEDETHGEMSLVRVNDAAGALTPVPRRTEGAMMAPPTAEKGSSLICLTPLSDFTLHQADDPAHLNVSYVADRTHPTSLQQAHGQLSLAVDDMVKAITDVEPYEPYWGQVRRLSLTGKNLTTLHRLQDYCADLEELDISNNEIGQLSGIPVSVRLFTAQHNCLTNLTSWGSLRNLQYLDISDNGLESLEGFSSLIHLRELKANRNRIRNIEGIFDLNGLLSLKLKGNELTSVDFEGAELPRLTHLDLSSNTLATAQNIHDLPSLDTLNLENNIINAFELRPDLKMWKLRTLRLSNNEIRIFDVAPFPVLQVLYLDNNKINSLLSFSTAHNLQTFSLREQSESPDILNHALSIVHDCRKLYLSCNLCPDGELKCPALPQLNVQYLELASCGLSSIPEGFGTMLPNCRVLNLNFNAIKSISPLHGILRLNKLLLAGNRIARMRSTCLLLASFTALTKIDLRNNPLTIGFYPPCNTGEHRLVVQEPEEAPEHQDLVDPFTLPDGDKALDEKWEARLDQVTLMKRRVMKLLLAENCSQLVWVDGVDWSKDELCKLEKVCIQLKELGILKSQRDAPVQTVEESISLHEIHRGARTTKGYVNSNRKCGGGLL